MSMIIAVGLFLILMFAISWFGYRRYVQPVRLFDELRRGQLGQPVYRSEVIASERAPREKPLMRVVSQVGAMLPVAPGDVKAARRELIQAGYRGENAVQIYYGLRVFGAAAGLLLALLMKDSLTASPVLRIVLLIFGAFAGWAVPSFLLSRKVAKRQEKLRLSLPDALDLLVISVEAGLGLDQAIQNVSRELQITHRELSYELSLMTLEMRAGKRRADALRNLADRTGEEETRKLVAILIQSDRFGTSMADSLRTHSDFMRVRRKQDAEERAGKVGVKLVFPIFFFILPSMMLVAAGPGLLQIFKNLFPLMEQVAR